MVKHRVLLSQLVACPFLGNNMQEDRAFHCTQVLQRGHKCVQIVAIDRAVIVKAEFLEQCGWAHHPFHMFFQPVRQFIQGRSHAQNTFADFLHIVQHAARQQFRQVLVQRTHGWRDGHIVVIQNDQQINVGRHTCIVQGFESHAGCH